MFLIFCVVLLLDLLILDLVGSRWQVILIFDNFQQVELNIIDYHFIAKQLDHNYLLILVNE